MLSGLLHRAQANRDGDGTVAQDHYGRRQQARLSHDNRFHVIGNQGRAVNVKVQGFSVEEDQCSASNMTHRKSHDGDSYCGAARWNGDCFTASGHFGEFTHTSSSSRSWNQETYNQKPPVYHRTSPNVDSCSYSPLRRGSKWRAGQHDVRRYAPYVKQRPAYTAAKPFISPVSPSYHPSFEQQKYVPSSNPNIPPMTTHDNHFSSYNEAAPCYPRQAQQHYRSPTSPPDYSPVSPLYQSGILKPTVGRRPPSRVDEVTKAKLQRQLAITLLTEKYKTTMAKEYEKRRIEYDPSAPTYKQDSTKIRLEYDPASPEY